MSRIISSGGNDSGGGGGGGGFVWNYRLAISDETITDRKAYSSSKLTNGTVHLHLDSLEVNTLDVVTELVSTDPIVDLGTVGVAAAQGGYRVLNPSGAAPNALVVWDHATQTVQAGPEGSTRALGFRDEHGDVEGPASSIDNALARFDLTTGKVIQSSGSTLSDLGDLVVERNFSSQDATVRAGYYLRSNYLGATSGSAIAVTSSLNSTANMALNQLKVGPTRVNDTVGSVADVHVQSTVNGTSTVWLETDATNSDAPEKGEALLLFSADANSHQYEVKVDNTTSNELQFRGVNYLGGGTMGFYIGDTVGLTPGAGSRGTITRAGTKQLGIGGTGILVDTISEITTGGGVNVDGVLCKAGVVSVDTIGEKTVGAGVTVSNTLKAQFADIGVIQEFTLGNGVTVDGVLLQDGAARPINGVYADNIYERTADAGVTVDGVLHKNSFIRALPTGLSDDANVSCNRFGSSVNPRCATFGPSTGGGEFVIIVHTATNNTNIGAQTYDAAGAFVGNSTLKFLASSPVSVLNTTESSALGSGALVVSGGASIALNARVGNTLYTNFLSELSSGSGIEMTGTLKAGTINELIFNSGVTVEGVLLKDSVVTAATVQTTGTTVAANQTRFSSFSGTGTAYPQNMAFQAGHAASDTFVSVITDAGRTYLAGLNAAVAYTALSISPSSPLVVESTTASSSTTTGALIVKGGLAVVGNINSGAVVSGTHLSVDNINERTAGAGITYGAATHIVVSDTTAATSTTTGALRVAGGVGIAGAVFVGGNVTAAAPTLGSHLATKTYVDSAAGGGAVTSWSPGTWTFATNGSGLPTISLGKYQVIGKQVFYSLVVTGQSVTTAGILTEINFSRPPPVLADNTLDQNIGTAVIIDDSTVETVVAGVTSGAFTLNATIRWISNDTGTFKLYLRGSYFTT